MTSNWCYNPSMGVFYTGKGDGGKSLLWDGKKIDKSSKEIDLLGSLDELNSLLGIIRSNGNENLSTRIFEIQQNLFTIQAIVFFAIIGRLKDAPPFEKQKTETLEKEIDRIEKTTSPQKKFVIPGESKTASWLDFARANTRKAERMAFSFAKKKKIPKEVLSYLNRLSSLFFAMARRETEIEGIKEQNPKY